VRLIWLVVALGLCASCTAGRPGEFDRPPQPFIVASLPSSVEVVDAATGRIVSTIDLGRHAGLAGVTTNAAERTAYVENDPGRCSVRVDAVSLRDRQVRTVAVVRGGYIDSVSDHPVLSPDGRYLALIVASGPVSYVNGIGRRCAGPEEIVVLDLANHTRRTWTGTWTFGGPADLQWAPDSRHLAYLVSGLARKGAAGEYVLNIGAAGRSYLDGSKVLSYGPVFWWHGREVVARHGVLYLVGDHAAKRPMSPVAEGFPRSVKAVSADSDGADLLVQDRANRTWWWDGDRSHLIPSPARGSWLEPTW
jgi:hypothetical protein